jgi:5,10-methylenetetrahydrofolate reductase
MELKTKMLDSEKGLYLYGTVPPRIDSPQDKVQTVAEKLAARLSGLNVDAINVYDLQDEGDRTLLPRPFPYLQTIDPRTYARILKDLTGREIIDYKCVVHHPRETFADWLSETWEQFGIRYLTLVGGSTSLAIYPGPTLSEACEITAFHKHKFVFGGVTIAERHTRKGNEPQRLIAKSHAGMAFFTSQVVYQADETIRLLNHYDRACHEQAVTPVRIVLTFAPCGHPKTSQFMKWLGINLPPACEAEIFSAVSPLDKSLEVCCVNLEQILASLETRRIPLGINVESVSIFKDEIDASIELFERLRAILESFYGFN